VDAGGSGRESGLARNAIGLQEVLFQSVTAIGPAAAVAFSIAVAAVYAGGALVLSVLVAMVACLFVASSIGQLSKHLPSAGGLYTYTARGLHPGVGFLVGWEFSMIWALSAPVNYLLMGNLLGGVFASEFGWSFGVTWVVVAIICAIAITVLNFFGVQASTRTGVVMGAFEILVFVVLGFWLIVKAGSNNTLSVFTTKFATIPHYHGLSGIFAGSVFTVLAFLGFEAAAPLAEEARHPRRQIKIAVVLSAVAIGVLFLFTTYASTVFFGPSHFASFASFGGGNPWLQLSRSIWGVGWIIVLIAIANSILAASNAAMNVVTRTWFSMGRIGVFPGVLAKTHPRWRSPYIAIVAQLVIGLPLALWLGEVYGPVEGFVLMATILTAVMICIYIAVDIACMVFYLRHRRSEFNVLLHAIFPVLGVLFFLPALLASLGVGRSLFSFISPLTYPADLTGIVVAIWTVIGLAYLVFLWRRHPERITATDQVFIEGSTPTEEPSEALP
jgi:amino acid transporter